jgi:CheY-like chemotaxis protein
MKRNLRVLIIEDHPDLSDLAALVLKSRGHQPVCALSGKAALDRLKDGEFNLIVLDLSLPDMDAADFVTAVKANPKWDKIPLLLASGRPDIDEWSKRFGGLPKLMKPYDLESLVQNVEKLAV